MSKFDLALPNMFGGWLHQLWINYHFKFVLPKIELATVDGIRLDFRSFSPKIRNRILMGYEESEKRMCRAVLTPEDSVLEIGGGIGFLGLFCQKKIGISRYITVEANPATIEILKRNYELNGFTPTVWNLALGRDDSTAELNVGGDFWEHSVGYSAQRNRPNTLHVPSISLGCVLKKAGAGTNALIIDIEGAERFIDFNEIGDGINKIIIELHPQLIGRNVASKILSTLAQKGFRAAHEQNDTFALLKQS